MNIEISPSALRGELRKNFIPQSEVASRAGVTQAYVSAVLLGKRESTRVLLAAAELILDKKKAGKGRKAS